jgi:CBS domain-containing protein
MRAMDVMTTDVITVDPETTVQSLATLLAERGISGAPVVDSDGRLVGVISEGDLLHRAEIGTARRHRVRRRSWWLDHFASDLAREYVKSHGRTVKEIMTRDVVTVTEDTELAEVAELLVAKRIKRVPVMREGKLLGSSAAQILCARSERQRARHPPKERETIARSAPGSLPNSAVRSGRRSGQRTLLSATVLFISGFPRTSLVKKGTRCGSRRKRSLACAGSRNTSSPPQWSPHSSPHRRTSRL